VIGAAIFSSIEGWSYGNAVYAVIILSLTIGEPFTLPQSCALLTMTNRIRRFRSHSAGRQDRFHSLRPHGCPNRHFLRWADDHRSCRHPFNDPISTDGLRGFIAVYLLEALLRGRNVEARAPHRPGRLQVAQRLHFPRARVVR
jgi:hypothetical protein